MAMIGSTSTKRPADSGDMPSQAMHESRPSELCLTGDPKQCVYFERRALNGWQWVRQRVGDDRFVSVRPFIRVCSHIFSRPYNVVDAAVQSGEKCRVSRALSSGATKRNQAVVLSTPITRRVFSFNPLV